MTTTVQDIAAVAWRCIKECKAHQPPPVMCLKHQLEAEAIAQRLRAPEGASEAGWQPIKTAPKDGTTILVGTSTWYALSNYYGDKEESWFTWYPPVVGNRPHHDGPRAEQPTHWMPLPAPPHAREGEREKEHGS